MSHDLVVSTADSVVVILGLDNGDRNVWLVIENIIGTLGLAAGGQATTDDDPTFGEGDLFANLRQDVPARLLDGGRDELGANVAFTKAFFVL